jgi:hypothetical protein
MSAIHLSALFALCLAAEFLPGGWSFAAFIFAVAFSIALLRMNHSHS